MRFTHLHVHSHYSLLDGLPTIDQLLDYAKKLGMDSLALTDHGVMYGAVEFYKKAKKKGIKPIIGIEAYQALNKRTDRRPGIDDKRYHLVLLAKNETGYKNLVKLTTRAHLEGFYYKPRIDEELLEEYSEGLICLSGCLAGKIPKLILANKIEEAERTASKYKELFGKDDFYLELQHHPHIPEQKKVNNALISISKKLGIPLVATNDCHYLRPEDADAQDILMLINTNANPQDPERLTMKMDDFSLRTSQQMAEAFKEIPEALENTQKIVQMCNFNFKLGKVSLPKFQTPNGKTPDEYIRELCLLGLKKRYGPKPPQKVIQRLNYELSVISKMGFSSYFLIVQDFVNWAKQNRIVVGPGRGSAGGSLVSYLLNITNIDPIKYNLMFERFLNPGRAKVSLPDIDIDFTDRRRDEVINYIKQKYGENHVAQIITFGTMAARVVVRDVGRALGYPYNYCDKLAKMIPFNFSLEEALAKLPEFRQIYETDEKAQKLIDFAKKLEGVARHASTHACGVVISDKPLDDIVPLQKSSQNDSTIVSQYEMHSIEDLGLLKMDLLGLKNLTIIEDTLVRIYEVQNKKIDIENIPLTDRATFKLFQRGETIGVFQCESEGFRKYLRQLKPTEMEDLIAMVALYRPGPMQFIPDFIAGKRKKKKITYLHPKLKPILEKTQGICIYQEQLMEIAQKLAGFSLSEADLLRKAVGKKIRSLLLEQEEKLTQGMKKNGIPENVAKKIWQWVLPFARYGFNRSHSCAYAQIAYQTAYLKAHFPVEFMAALLTSEKNDVERIGFLIGECKKMHIDVLPPDINESWRNFTVVPKKNQIRFGFLAIKNVGTNVVEAIVKERKENGPFRSIKDFFSRMPSSVMNKKSLESLIKAGAFDKLAERNQLLMGLEGLLEFNRENRKKKMSGQQGLFDRIKSDNELSLPKAKPATKKEKIFWEKELLGLFVSSHPLEGFQKVLAKKALPISKIGSGITGHLCRIGGIISEIKRIITKNGSPMLFVKMEDLTDKIEVVVFPSVLSKNPSAFQENKIVLVSGRISERGDTPKLIAENVEELVEEG